MYEKLYSILLKKVKQYHPAQDVSSIEKAYKLALDAHKEQYRKSGEPYIIHPLSVAIILAELGSDMESLVAGILHDVIEDTDYTYQDIVDNFGEEVALLVDGVTKLDRITYQSEKENKNSKQNISKLEELQAENYRKMFLAMAKDIRVIIIKIADRLHNMRTLEYMRPEKQKEKAQETLDIYSPLAHRLGIAKIRYELEDLSLMYLDPHGYEYVKRKIKYQQEKRQEILNKIVTSIKEKMDNANIKGTVEGRPKHIYSIYKKMKRKNIGIDQMYDIFAVRAIVNNVMECYSILGIVHEAYIPIPGRFKDYIAMPKQNMYQSLHTTLTSKDLETFELQIKTWDMYKTAEYGIAAHWKYKESPGGIVKPGSEEAKLSWLRQMLDWQRDLSDNKEYLADLKTELSMFQDSVYCFTPKGEVISLIAGSTPIDFAYLIHSSIGNHMIGARVNSKIVPFDYELNTGDKVEILTSRNTKGPKKEWCNIVKTTQAKTKINQWFRKQNKEENIEKGKFLLEEVANKKRINLEELLNDDRKKYLIDRYNYLDWDSLLAGVGYGGLKEGQVVNRLLAKVKEDEFLDSKKIIENLNISDKNIDLNDVLEIQKNKIIPKKSKSGIVVRGIGDVFVRFSRCCNPVPGDEIVGFVTRGRGVSIHRTDCKNIINLTDDDLNRLIDAEWEGKEIIADMSYRVEINIVCEDRLGILVGISRVLEESKIEIRSIQSRTTNDKAIFNLLLEIKSREQLEKVCDKILSLPGVDNINRV